MRSAIRTGGLADQHRANRLSRLSVAVFFAAFLIGIIEGAINYAHRSPVIERHVAGTNAITVHVVLAIVAVAVVAVVQLSASRRASNRAGSPWVAPFSTNAFARLRRTIRTSRGLSTVRLLPTALLLLVLLYAPFRMGMQIVGGIDPNATVNAWGGPTYLGALLAHWLDCIIGFYAVAFLMSQLLAKSSG